MNDKELLLMAAKAAGLSLQGRDMKGGYERILTNPVTGGAEWNPLTDDGDALRLAVKLELDFVNYQNSVEVHAYLDCEPIDTVSEEVSGCRLAATRRAIVRAAAAIGEEL